MHDFDKYFYFSLEKTFFLESKLKLQNLKKNLLTTYFYALFNRYFQPFICQSKKLKTGQLIRYPK